MPQLVHNVSSTFLSEVTQKANDEGQSISEFILSAIKVKMGQEEDGDDEDNAGEFKSLPKRGRKPKAGAAQE